MEYNPGQAVPERVWLRKCNNRVVRKEIKNFKTYEGNPQQVKHWLDTTRSDALVLIDIHPGTTFDWKTDEYVDLSAFNQALAEQSVWALAQRWEMPEGVTITLWKKSGS